MTRLISATLFLMGLAGSALLVYMVKSEPSSVPWDTLLANEGEILVAEAGELWEVKNGRLGEGASAHARAQEKILRTAWYHAVHTRDPILSLSGVDVEHLAEAIEELSTTIEQIAGLFPSLSDRIAIWHMHPMEFFQLLPDLERKRRALGSLPSERAAVSYHRALTKTLQAYIREAKRLSDILEGQNIQAPFYTTRASIVSVRTTLQTLQEQALASLGIEEARFSCFQGNREDCSTPSFPSLLLMSEDKKTPTHLSQEALHLVRVVSGLQAGHSLQDTQLLPHSGRIVEISREKCGFASPEPFYYWEAQDLRTGLIAAKSDSLSDAGFLRTIFFAKTAQSRSTSNPLADMFKEGNPLYHQGLTLYLCLDAGYDLSRILTVLELRRLADESPLAPLLPEMRQAEVFRAEQNLAHEPYPSDTLSEEYVATLAALLQDEASDEQVDKGVVQEMRARVDMWRTQSAQMEKMIMNAVAVNRGLLFYAHFSPDIRGLLLTRSFPSVFFLPFNQTLVREETSFSLSQIDGEELRTENRPFRTTLEVLLRSMPLSLVEDYVRRSIFSENLLEMRILANERKLLPLFPPSTQFILDPLLVKLRERILRLAPMVMEKEHTPPVMQPLPPESPSL